MPYCQRIVGDNKILIPNTFSVSKNTQNLNKLVQKVFINSFLLICVIKNVCYVTIINRSLFVSPMFIRKHVNKLMFV